MRPGVTSMILALPCTPSVMTPAWLPVNERALKPRSEIAMATRAIEMRSPAVISMSSSRGGGTGLTSRARSSRSSVVSPMADTATTTSWPAFFVSAIRRATRLMLSASASDDPPYFWTTMGTCYSRDGGSCGVATTLTGRPRTGRDARMPVSRHPLIRVRPLAATSRDLPRGPPGRVREVR